jgi:hypothetical protein
MLTFYFNDARITVKILHSCENKTKRRRQQPQEASSLL